MKVVVLILAAAAAGGAGVVALAGRSVPRWSSEHLDRLRGTDAYYAEEQDQAMIGPLEVRLRGEPPTLLLVGITFTYRRGLETADAGPLIASHRKILIDRLTVHLSDQRREDLEDRPKLYRLKRDLRRILEDALFPGQEVRVERIWFDPFWFQVIQ